MTPETTAPRLAETVGGRGAARQSPTVHRSGRWHPPGLVPRKSQAPWGEPTRSAPGGPAHAPRTGAHRPTLGSQLLHGHEAESHTARAHGRGRSSWGSRGPWRRPGGHPPLARESSRWRPFRQGAVLVASRGDRRAPQCVTESRFLSKFPCAPKAQPKKETNQHSGSEAALAPAHLAWPHTWPRTWPRASKRNLPTDSAGPRSQGSGAGTLMLH